MVTALRMIGFDKVFDTNYGADLTITEEANELIERIKSGKKNANGYFLLSRLGKLYGKTLS